MNVTDIINPIDLGAVVPDPGSWQPFPDASDSASWSKADEASIAGFVRTAEELLTETWPTLPASLWLLFSNSGIRDPYEKAYTRRRLRVSVMAIAFAATLREDFLSDLIDGIWMVCEETTWCLPPHDFSRLERNDRLPNPDRPYVDLFAAETGAMLAWVDLIVGQALDERSPQVRARIRNLVRQRVLDPYRSTMDWVWFDEKANNWNAWIHSNLIPTSLLLDYDQYRVIQLIHQAAKGLDHYLRELPDDGGSDEGLGYWWRSGASFFECAQWLHAATDAVVDLFPLPQLIGTARYPATVHIAGDWSVNFADCGARNPPQQQPSQLLFRLGVRVGDQSAVQQAVASRVDGPAAPIGASLGRVLPALFDRDWAEATPTEYPFVEESFLPATQIWSAREHEGSPSGFFIAAKGGHNAESHNHNDVGSFIVALDGEPLIVDAGVGVYTDRTFSHHRYDIWTMRSAFHNVPIIHGCEQRAGRRFQARNVHASNGVGASAFSLDIADAYPEEVGAQHWSRTMTLSRATGEIHIRETWKTADPGKVTWTFLLRERPSEVSANAIDVHASSARAKLTHSIPDAVAEIEPIALADEKLEYSWGTDLYRLTITAECPADGTATFAISCGR